MAASRRSSWQMRQVASVARLKQTSQWPTVSLTSRIASASASASSSGTLQDVEREPLRRALPDAGQARELGDQAVDRRCEQASLA